MHIQRQTPTELILQDGSMWMSFIFIPAAIFVAALSVEKHKPLGLLVAAFFLLFAALFTRHSTFTLNGMQRIVRWRRRTFLKDESGSIPFDLIRDIILDAQARDRNSVGYRLSIVTVDGATPMANVFSGGRIEHYQQLRRQILDFIGLGSMANAPGIPSKIVPSDISTPLGCSGIPADIEPSLRALLEQGRTIDAIRLLQSREDFGIADAKSRIDALRETLKSPS